MVDRQPPVEGLVEMSLAASRDWDLPVSGHPSLGMNETCWRLPALCWMRKEREGTVFRAEWGEGWTKRCSWRVREPADRACTVTKF